MRRASAGSKVSVERGGGVRREVVQDDANAFGRRVVRVDKVAHALGEVAARSPIGHLCMAPRPMGVDEHEDVRRAVADVLVVETCRPPGLRRYGHARLADQLPWGLVEANNGVQRVRFLGVEVEDVLHACDELRVHGGDAPHLLQPRFQLIFRESATDGVGRDRVVLRQPHRLAREKFQRPTCSTDRRRQARGRDEKRLLLLRELAVGARTRQFAECGLEPLFDETSLRSIDRRGPHRDVLRDCRVTRTGLGCDKDLSQALTLALADEDVAERWARGEKPLAEARMARSIERSRGYAALYDPARLVLHTRAGHDAPKKKRKKR